MLDRPSSRRFLMTNGTAISGFWLRGGAALANQQPTTAAALSQTQVIDDLVAANRVLAQEQILDGFGHVSARHPRLPDRFLLARSVAPELVTATDIMEYDLDANPSDARGRTSYRE